MRSAFDRRVVPEEILTLVWLLRTFPTRPLPVMLEPLDEAELRSFRDALAERLKRAARP